uniref:Uncharacterized protein n=1 Tax=Schizaphis graminum TaxID=13262 RepID=A0A2S2P1H2_SCHGA
MAGMYIRRHGSVVVESPSSSLAVHSQNQQIPAAAAVLPWRSDSYQVNGPCNSVDPLGNNPLPAEHGAVVQLTKLRHNCPAHNDDLQSPHHFQQGFFSVISENRKSITFQNNNESTSSKQLFYGIIMRKHYISKHRYEKKSFLNTK